jgi:hypothetical protein
VGVQVGGQVGDAGCGDGGGQGGGCGGGDGGPAGDLVVGLVVEHGQVERFEQLLLDPAGQPGQRVPERGQGIEQPGVAAVVVGLVARSVSLPGAWARWAGS